ncbi:MAG: amidohydrolase family protein [SAR202 cluster bacterium]|nr:amidohydrolase family protein [SAR202 cluster bacterium]
MADFDMLIRAERVFCAATGIDGPGEIAVAGGRIATAGKKVGGRAGRVLEFPDGIAVPGLIDLHTHPAPDDWKYGIGPDRLVLPRGTTTIMSQGDPGAANWNRYMEHVIRPSKTRVLVALSVSRNGEEPPGYCFENPEDLDVEAAVSAINSNPGSIWGVSVNVSSAATGKADPGMVMEHALEIAESTGRPIMFGNRWEPYDWPIAEQMALLRPGDVITYCFHKGPNNILDANGRILNAVRDARDRGVLFDIGHGMASFDFAVAEAAIAQGFLPDTISTDQYKRHTGLRPRHDLPRTISKLVAAGMALEEALTRTTLRPAKVLGMEGEIGVLAPGACADIAVLRWNHAAQALADVSGAVRPGPVLEAVATIREGQVVGGG